MSVNFLKTMSCIPIRLPFCVRRKSICFYFIRNVFSPSSWIGEINLLSIQVKHGKERRLMVIMLPWLPEQDHSIIHFIGIFNIIWIYWNQMESTFFEWRVHVSSVLRISIYFYVRISIYFFTVSYIFLMNQITFNKFAVSNHLVVLKLLVVYFQFKCKRCATITLKWWWRMYETFIN